MLLLLARPRNNNNLLAFSKEIFLPAVIFRKTEQQRPKRIFFRRPFFRRKFSVRLEFLFSLHHRQNRNHNEYFFVTMKKAKTSSCLKMDRVWSPGNNYNYNDNPWKFSFYFSWQQSFGFHFSWFDNEGCRRITAPPALHISSAVTARAVPSRNWRV